jgi:hypothetical protein
LGIAIGEKKIVELHMEKTNINRLGTEPIGRLLLSMSSQTTLALLL